MYTKPLWQKGHDSRSINEIPTFVTVAHNRFFFTQLKTRKFVINFFLILFFFSYFFLLTCFVNDLTMRMELETWQKWIVRDIKTTFKINFIFSNNFCSILFTCFYFDISKQGLVQSTWKWLMTVPFGQCCAPLFTWKAQARKQKKKFLPNMSDTMITIIQEQSCKDINNYKGESYVKEMTYRWWTESLNSVTTSATKKRRKVRGFIHLKLFIDLCSDITFALFSDRYNDVS